MFSLSNFRPNKDNQGTQIDMVRCDTYSSNFESLYNTYTTYYEENPNGSWFPEFQRGSVWSQEQKEQLVLSMLNGLPIGAFYLNEWWSDDEEKRAKIDHVLFDGQQRFIAILEFLTGHFPITFEGKEYYVTDLSFQEWLNIKRYPISIVHSYIEEWNDLIDFYVLINKGGTAHTLEEFQKALDCKE